MTQDQIKAPIDPSETSKDYHIDWSDVLGAEGETAIASSTWSGSDPTGLAFVDGSPPMGSPPTGYIDGVNTIIWVSAAGCTVGTKYTLKNDIVTAGPTPRTHTRRIVIPCVYL